MTQRTCSLDGCDRPHYGNGLCQRDYARLKRTGTTDAPPDVCRKEGHPLTPDNVIVDEKTGKRRCLKCREAYKAAFIPAGICSVPGCGRPAIAKGLCTRDYQRMKIKGNTDDPVRLTPEERILHRRAAVNAHYARNRVASRRKARARYRANAKAENERSRRWREANPERNAEIQRAWREANPERRAELYRKWVADNPERVRAIHRDKSGRRRARMAATSVGPVDYVRIIAEFGMTCHICRGEIASLSHLDFDHVIPIARGGGHIQGNVLPSHARCNRRKGAKLMSELIAPESWKPPAVA